MPKFIYLFIFETPKFIYLFWKKNVHTHKDRECDSKIKAHHNWIKIVLHYFRHPLLGLANLEAVK